MTVSVWTVGALFLGLTSAVLAVLAAVTALRTTRDLSRWDGAPGSRDALEERAHLVTLLVGVLAALRLIAWPHFYLLMKSLVPGLATYGVMCTYGVTRLDAGLVGALQVGKPLVLLGLGFWATLGWLDRRAGAPLFLRSRLVLIVPLAGLALAECAAEIGYVFREQAGEPVTCCTQFIDTEAATGWKDLSLSSFGRGGSPAVLFALYALLGLVTAAGTLFFARTGFPVRRGRSASAGLALVGGAALLSTWPAWSDWVAPRVLQLPYHHCLYELLTDTAAFGLAAVAAVLGCGSLTWVAALEWFRGRAPEAVRQVQGSVLRFAATAQVTSLLIVFVHVL